MATQIHPTAVVEPGARLGEGVRIGAFSIVGPEVSLGDGCVLHGHVVVGGVTGVERDVIPFGSVMGDRARLSGINIVGMKRRGLSRDEIHDVRKAYRLLFASEGTFQERLDEVAVEFTSSAPVMEIVDFIRADSSRKICQPEDANDL